MSGYFLNQAIGTHWARIVQGALLVLPNSVLPFIGPVPHMAWAALAAFSVAVYQPSIRKEDWPFFLFAFGVILNAALGVAVSGAWPQSLLVNNGFVGGLLLMAAYLTARTFNDTVWTIALVLIAVEAGAIYVQFASGVRFFFPAQEMVTAGTEFQFAQSVGNEDLWYRIRPQGFSISSTIAGAKMLLGILIAYMLPFSRRWRWGLIAFLLGALALNFKRSGIVSVGAFAGILFVLDIARCGWRPRHTATAAAAGLVATYGLSTIIVQMTRDAADSVGDLSPSILIAQLSGRADIWNETWAFIGQHLFFGNHSTRFILLGGGYAHSSILTLLATHGLFLAVLLLGFMASKIARDARLLIVLVPLLIDSLFQEHIFWYISMMDLFVLYLLVKRGSSAAWSEPWPTATAQTRVVPQAA